eukprot:CAMPEP_0168746372 /NCGR_PEP_ID=MMETSP0724-20121128/15114_1 /TAXON_ID=265536 /ORGANISM="Amphiprora sp., Strain CCMP467" /LENGTH=952 /DNA_ID=CAMNT_0008794143 /DNA_START=161 /DNA_END=3019 /DNA_ORIENTATION=-
MKFTSAVLLFLWAAPTCMAFVPSSYAPNGVRGAPFMSMSVSESVDVKIPYDAAARLAYDEWREQFNKGDFDEARYEVFKTNYEAISVANVVAKKEAREEGSEMPGLMKLNEYGDCTEEEYQAALEAESSAPTSTGDVLGKALDAAQSQSEASSALKEAADALAEEEEELAKKLGMDSVEELEDALDAMNGIADDGGELESSGDIAREARAREAYLGWCKKFNKQEDEARYPTFVENFLSMEKFAQETGKEMNLNEYADCTEAEFLAIQKEKKKSEPAPAPATMPKPVPVASAPAEKLTPQKMLEKRLEAEAKVRAETEAAEKKRQEAKEALMKAQAEARAVAAKEEEERRKEIEKEQKARQAAQDKAAAKFEADSTAAAIAAAKEAAEREAAQVAKRRADAEKAAELLRKKNAEWEAKQKRVAASSAKTLKTTFKAPEIKVAQKKVVAVKPTPARPKGRPTLNVAEAAAAMLSAPAKAAKKAAKSAPAFSFFGEPEEAKPAKKAAPKAVAKPAPKAAAKAAPKPVAKKEAPAAGLFSFLNAPTEPAAKKAAPAPKKKVQVVAPTPAPAAKKEEPAGLFSFLGAPAEKKAPPKAAVKKAAPSPAPVAPPAPKAAAKKAAPAFSFFSSPPKPAAKKVSPTPAPVAPPAPKAAVKKAAPAFSFFSSPPKPAAKKAAPAAPKAVVPPTPAPVAKKSAPAFSFFGSPAKPAAKKETPAPAPAPVALPSIKSPPTQPAFSFFGGATATAPKKAAKKAAPKKTPVKEISDDVPGTVALFFGKDKKVEKKVIEEAKRAPTFSLFGGTQSIADTEIEPPAPKAVPKRATLSIFGAGAPKKKAAPKKVDTPVPKGSGTLSLFGGAKKVAPAKKAEPAARKSIPIVKKAAKKAVKKAAKKVAVPAGVPVLSRWKQNADGSITGFISKSPNFRDNTKITTSPIRGKPGSAAVVQTGSGSKYYLS